MANVTFRVKGESKNPTCINVRARSFDFNVDEPEALGGTNLGPNPVEYLLGSLLGCLNVVGHIVAKEMGFEIEELKISASGSLNPAKFSGQGFEERAGFQSISAKMETKTSAGQDVLEKWARTIEERCPVSDNIANVTPVHILPVKK